MAAALVKLAYLVASILFILGLKGLSHPRTAVRGNTLGALGMLLAVVATLFDRSIVSFEVILAGMVVGGLIGATLATKIQMTAMPQMVALLNGFGGAASALVAGAALIEALGAGGALSSQLTVATAASGLIGGLTFWGSLVAFGKLQDILSGNPVLFPGRHVVNALLALSALGLAAAVVADPGNTTLYWALVGVASLLGVLTVIPIGGADMPVVISLLNSYSGLAACATGFVLSNNVLIIAGSLVGASGLILTQIMCKAMNRSLLNVLFGGVGAAAAGPRGDADAVYAGKIKATSADEVAMLLENVQRVVIVPGYGLAVSQAQHTVRDLARLLESRDVTVEYAIHPVAGRMPGHMNVLLAEADVAYDKLKEMDEINPTFEQTDVAIVVGANDVVNPVARTDPGSPIAGMPILDVDKARTVVMIKRSLDGKKALVDLIAAIKES